MISMLPFLLLYFKRSIAFFLHIFILKTFLTRKIPATKKLTDEYTEYSYQPIFIVTQTGNPRYVFYGYDFCKRNCVCSYANESPWPYIKKVFSVEIKYFQLKRKKWHHASAKFINGKTDYAHSWTEGSWIVSFASTRPLPQNILYQQLTCLKD